MMNTKIYLNQTSRFDTFSPFKAELLLAAEFEIEGSEPKFDFDAEAHKDLDNEAFDTVYRAAREDHSRWVDAHLNRVFEQLNVGGDMVPAEAYTVAYRLAGHRSLSVGDLIEFTFEKELEHVTRGGTPVVVTERLVYAVERFGFKRVSTLALRKGLERFEKNAGSIDHFLPVPRTDITVDENGLFARVEPVVTSFEFVQADLRNGL
jgi:hypothetical protein